MLIIFPGKNWEEKVEEIRSKMAVKNAHAVVVSALDEVACNHFNNFLNCHPLIKKLMVYSSNFSFRVVQLKRVRYRI